MKYCKYLGNGQFDRRLFSQQGENCYPYVSTAEKREGYSCFCVGFMWLNENVDCTGIYDYIETDENESEIRYSVRSVIRELRSINKYDYVRSMLEEAKLDWDFIGANFLSTNDPDFVVMCNAIVNSGIATEEELQNLLSKCIWQPE